MGTCILESAPYCSSSRAMATLPLSQARCSGVYPYTSETSMSPHMKNKTQLCTYIFILRIHVGGWITL